MQLGGKKDSKVFGFSQKSNYYGRDLTFVLYINRDLTIELVEASHDKLVVVSDFVYNSSKAAHTVLNNLKKHKTTKVSLKKKTLKGRF